MKTNFDLRKLDSLTKYPSILTYHKLGEKGKLTNELSFNIDLTNENLVVTEKIDGENSRMVFIIQDYQVDYFIGTRDELIYAKDDRMYNKHGNMVATVNPFAINISSNKEFINKYNNKLVVVYGESYGGKVQKASKQYTSNQSQSIKMFDCFIMDLSDVEEMLTKDLAQIASWRDNQHQPFIGEHELNNLVDIIDILSLTPRRNFIKGSEMSKDIEKTYEWLKSYSVSESGIDKTDGLSEGIVIRTNDRSYIVKIRFEDYERTLRNKK